MSTAASACPRAGSLPNADGLAVTAELRARLAAAGRLALDGRRQDARLACAALLRAHQPRIVLDAGLFQQVIDVLLRAGASEQLRRLLIASHGVAATAARPPPPPPLRALRVPGSAVGGVSQRSHQAWKLGELREEALAQ